MFGFVYHNNIELGTYIVHIVDFLSDVTAMTVALFNHLYVPYFLLNFEHFDWRT